jgi:type II secretory pathway component PulL
LRSALQRIRDIEEQCAVNIDGIHLHNVSGCRPNILILAVQNGYGISWLERAALQNLAYKRLSPRAFL